MSAILEGKPDKNLILVTGRIHPKLAEDVAEQLGVDRRALQKFRGPGPRSMGWHHGPGPMMDDSAMDD